MNKFGTSLFLGALSLGLMGLVGCGGSAESGVTISLTDSTAARVASGGDPINATSVIVNVIETTVKFKAADGEVEETPEATPLPDDDGEVDDEDGKWLVVSVDPVAVDLMSLADEASEIGTLMLEPGTIKEIRLLVDDANPGSITVDGTTYPLSIPSGTSSGFKLKGEITLEEGMITTVLVDFDAETSVNLTGNDEYQLKPTLKVSSTTTAAL